MFIRNVHRITRLAFRAMSTGTERSVITEEVGRSTGLITLNRPKALNTITLDMVRKIYGTLKSWQNTKSLIIIKGAGKRAFCAGGDVLKLVEDGSIAASTKAFFRENYRINALIASSRSDYLAILDGITMGGGAGLSVHGKYRIATERTLFSMPDAWIGLFPGVGGGYFLPRLQGNLGFYLGLTGFRLKGMDVVKAGIATHFVKSGDLEAFENALVATANSVEVTNVLSKFNVKDSSEFVLAKNLRQINECFSGSTMESIYANLERDGSEWAQSTLKSLDKMSPLSLKITKRYLEFGLPNDLRSCLKLEFRIVVRCMSDSNFKEGVRALLIYRDQNPRWNPPTLSEVTDQQVDQFFAPLPDGDELVFEDEMDGSF